MYSHYKDIKAATTANAATINVFHKFSQKEDDKGSSKSQFNLVNLIQGEHLRCHS